MIVYVHHEPGDVVDGELQDVEVRMTREQIIKEYYPSWCDLMNRAGKADLISEQNCIEDWVVVHWAEEIEVESDQRQT